MKKVLVLGAGMVSAPLVHYLLDNGFQVTLGDINEAQARSIIGDRKNAASLKVDIAEKEKVEALIKPMDLVVSLLPPQLHSQVAAMCLELEKNFLTASYLSNEISALDEAVKAKDLIFMNEIGLDPGLDHLTAMEIIDELNEKGYRILKFDSHCGGIPSRKAANNPLRYKFSWSPAGVLGAITRPSQFRRNGKIVRVPGRDKLHHAEVLHVPGSGIYESNPNADSLYYGERYGLSDTLDVRRGTLRYPGWAQFWLFMLSLDFLNKERHLVFKDEQVLNALFKLAGWTPPEDIFEFVRSKTDTHASVFLENMESLGLLDEENRVTGSYTSFDILLECAQKHMQYDPGETDLVVLHHEFLVEKDGMRENWTSTLSREGVPNGITAMGFLVGVPAAITARLILEGKIQQRGVLIPLDREFYQPILHEMGEMGMPHQIFRTPLED